MSSKSSRVRELSTIRFPLEKACLYRVSIVLVWGVIKGVKVTSLSTSNGIKNGNLTPKSNLEFDKNSGAKNPTALLADGSGMLIKGV